MQPFSSNEWLVGQVVDGSYLVTHLLGEGGFAVAYKAQQLELGRTVCIKFLRPTAITDVEILHRFKREARVLARLRHPGIVTCYSCGVFQDIFPYLVMEMISGSSLREELNRQALEWSRAVRICRQVCDALQFAHDRGFIHRDLKPDNVMFAGTDDDVKIIDFGLVGTNSQRATIELESLTETQTVLGSVHYMAPEVFTGKKTSASVDVYAVGCVLYEMLTAERPFDADNPMAILHKHVAEPLPELPQTIQPQAVREFLEGIIWTATDVDPKRRFSSCGEISSLLGDLLSSSEGDLVSFARRPPIRRSATRKRWLVATAAVLALLLPVGVASLHRSFSRVPSASRERQEFDVALCKLEVSLRAAETCCSPGGAPVAGRPASVGKECVERYAAGVREFILQHGAKACDPDVPSSQLINLCRRSGMLIRRAVAEQGGRNTGDLRALYTDLLVNCGLYRTAVEQLSNTINATTDNAGGWNVEALDKLGESSIVLPEPAAVRGRQDELDVLVTILQREIEKTPEDRRAYLMSRLRGAMAALVMVQEWKPFRKALRTFCVRHMAPEAYSPSLLQLGLKLKFSGSERAALMADLCELNLHQGHMEEANQALSEALRTTRYPGIDPGRQLSVLLADLGRVDQSVELLSNLRSQTNSVYWCIAVVQSADVCARMNRMQESQKFLNELSQSRQWRQVHERWLSSSFIDANVTFIVSHIAVANHFNIYHLAFLPVEKARAMNAKELKSARHFADAQLRLMMEVPRAQWFNHTTDKLLCLQDCTLVGLTAESFALSRNLYEETRGSKKGEYFEAALEYALRLQHAKRVSEARAVLSELAKSHPQDIESALNYAGEVRWRKEYRRLLLELR